VIEDVTAPNIESVTPREKTVIRVTYDEPINQTVATNSGSSLNPSNYAFSQISVPSVPIEAESVEIVTTNEVDVTIDVDMTSGASYQLVVTNVEDLLGNVILAPTNTVLFTGYEPEVSSSRSFELWKMLPLKNRVEDTGDLSKFISCLQEVTDLLLCSIDSWTDIFDPDIAPELFVDAILDDLANPFEFDLDLVDKRKLIRILVEIYRQKGTGVGIINAVRFFLGIEIEINAFSVEGWDLGIDELGDSSNEGTAELGPGTSYGLYSFEVVSPIALTDEQREQIETIAKYIKPAHTHLVQILEPEIPEVIDHIELGLSELGNEEWLLH
jgi:phage tail-like protein